MTHLVRAVALVYLLAASTTHAPGQLLAPWFGGRYAPRPQQQFCPPGGCPQQQPPMWGWPQQDPTQQPPRQAPPDLSTQVQLPANVQQSIVRISNASRVGGHNSIVTGSVIESNEGGTIVLTCAHMVDATSGSNFEVYFPNAQHAPATLIDIDPALDLAALHVPVQGVPVVPVAANPPNQGDQAFFAGYGGQGQILARSGRTVQYVTFKRSGPPEGAIQVTGGARSGDSGGPILNEAYELVGVISCSDGPEVAPGAPRIQIHQATETSGPTVMGTCCRHFPGFLQRMRARLAARRGHGTQSPRQQPPADVAPQPPAGPVAPLTPPLVQVPAQPSETHSNIAPAAARGPSETSPPSSVATDDRPGLLARIRERDTLIDRLRGEKTEGETERTGLRARLEEQAAKIKEHAGALVHRDRQVEGLKLDKEHLAATIRELREKGVAAVEHTLLTKLLITTGIVSPPLAGIAAAAILFVARRRGKKLRKQLGEKDSLLGKLTRRFEKMTASHVAPPAGGPTASASAFPGQTGEADHASANAPAENPILRAREFGQQLAERYIDEGGDPVLAVTRGRVYETEIDERLLTTTDPLAKSLMQEIKHAVQTRVNAVHPFTVGRSADQSTQE